MTQNVDQIITTLKNFTLADASVLIQKLEKEFAINLNAYTGENTVEIGSNSAQQQTILAVDEKTFFEVILVEISNDKKIPILKAVRQITNLGLKESKEFIESLPKTLKEGLSTEEAEQIKKEVEAAGGKVLIK